MCIQSTVLKLQCDQLQVILNKILEASHNFEVEGTQRDFSFAFSYVTKIGLLLEQCVVAQAEFLYVAIVLDHLQ